MNSRKLSPLAALLASACMTVPSPPASMATPAVAGPFANLPTASIAPVPDDWWRLYQDPVLDGLVEASLAANVDLRVAYANLDSVRAALRQARAARLPTTNVESGLTIDNTAGQPSTSNVPATDYDIAVTASWDTDLFGRLRSGALAAAADADAAVAAADGLRVAVVADTVLAYVDLCGANRGANVARSVLTAQERALAVVRSQLRAGEVSPLELSQSANLVAGTRATLPAFDAARANALYRLSTLQGRAPSESRGWTLGCAQVPKLSTKLPVGDGAALILRRPDIREAERRLAAAAARIGVARADLYPRINLGGAIGLLTGGLVATATPLISRAFPNQAPARARLEQARANERGALASWETTVLRALREVETALAAQDAEARRGAALVEALRQADLYARRSAAKVRLGDASPLLRIDAERLRASAELQSAQSELLLAQGEVALFRSLGGGWQRAPGPR